MSEEQNKPEAQAQTEQAQQQPVAQQPQATEQKPLPSVIDIMFGNQAQQQVEAAQTATEERGQEAQAQNQNQQQANVPAAENKEKVEDDPFLIKSPIFGEEGYKLKTENDKAVEEQNANQNPIPENIYKDFGFENPEELKSAVDFYKTQKPEYEKIKQDNDYFIELFDKAPKELYQAFKDFSEGKDWTQSVKNIRPFDITKDVAQQETKTLVEHYLPGKFTKEEWDEYNDPDGDPMIKRAIDLSVDISKREFQKEQQDIQSQVEKEVQVAQQKQQVFEQSVKEATQSLSEKFEGIDKRYVDKVTEELKSQKFLSLFYNPDGTFTKEAGERLVMAQHGYDLMRQYQHAAAVKARNEVTEDILSRGADRPTARQQQNRGAELGQEEQKQVQFYESLLSNKKTF
jgi:hypothetical protein